MNHTTYITIALAVIAFVIILIVHRRLWTPEYNEHYWYLDSDGIVKRSRWEGRELDVQRLRNSNVYKKPEYIVKGVKEEVEL